MLGVMIINAETIGRALSGRNHGSYWMARCPAHNDRNPSLSIRKGHDGRVSIKCFAGCSREAVLQELRARGLWSGSANSGFQFAPVAAQPAEQGHGRDDQARSDFAKRIWKRAKPATGTLVEGYLQSRGIIVQPPASLGYAPALKHSPSGLRLPTMLAAVTRWPSRRVIAVHRTYLALNGESKAAVDLSRMMLGPCHGGAVRLAAAGEMLMVGEGIETCLAAMQATGYPTWAALSTSGLRTLELPEGVRHVVVLADGDDAGESAAVACALRWAKEGRRVRIARPPRGSDFNDLLLGKGSRIEGAGDDQ
jgi:hypothetical protein